MSASSRCRSRSGRRCSASGTYVEIPAIGCIRRSSRPPSSSARRRTRTAARRFLDFLKQPDTSDLLRRFGFAPPPPAVAVSIATRYNRHHHMDWQAIWLTARLAAIVSRHPAGHQPAAGPLADVLPPALDVPRRIGRLAAARAAADGARLLSADGDGLAKPARPLVDGAGPATGWPSRSKAWSSRRCSTACRSRCSRSPRRSRRSTGAARGVGDARRVAAAHVPARHAAAVARRRPRRRRPELRPHGRRVRRRADGRRQPAGRHAHRVDRDLRRRAGAASTRRRTRPRWCCWRFRCSCCRRSTASAGGRGRRRRSHERRRRHPRSGCRRAFALDVAFTAPAGHHDPVRRVGLGQDDRPARHGRADASRRRPHRDRRSGVLRRARRRGRRRSSSVASATSSSSSRCFRT